MHRSIVIVVSLAAASVASAAVPRDLATSNLNTPAGLMTALAARTVYQASAFPVPLRITTPDGTWAGSQWTTTSHGKRTFGWAAVGHGGTSATSAPQGLITLVTPLGATPSVSATVARIRRGGSGITFEDPSAVKVAGYAGTRFDGSVWGIYGHTIVPFTATTHGAAPSDSWHIDKGEAFRFVVLNVRGRTVVVFLESFGLAPELFPGFVASSAPLLAKLRFPA